MKYLVATTQTREPAHSRRAATLSEVLVSIMILSIGLISLAALFPISILRSLQATQLTNGAILSMNAEAAIDSSPEMVFDPDGDFNPDNPQFSALAEHFQFPNTRNYIVDPLGWNRAAAADRDNFGSERLATDELPRYPGVVWKSGSTTNRDRLDTESEALSVVTLPDSWVDQDIESTGTLTTGAPPNPVSSFTFAEGDLSGVAYGGAVLSRIVLFDVSGKKSQVRTITNIAGQTVSWNGEYNLPVGLARIETKETRYTWLLTVRQASSGLTALVEVVVFFRRPDPSPQIEKHYQAVFTGPDSVTNAPGSRDATISFAVGEEPPLKKGGFIFDATNAHWYRIQNITNETTTGATLRLDRPARATGNSAMVLEGVIDVFPLVPKRNALLQRLYQ